MHQAGAHLFRIATRALMWAVALLAVCLAALPSLGTPGSAARADSPFFDGSDSQCSSWRIELDLLFVDLPIQTIAEEGWVYVNGLGTADRLRDASGVVTKSKVGDVKFCSLQMRFRVWLRSSWPFIPAR